MTTLDPETLTELTRLGVTADQIATLQDALDNAARGHEKMNTDFALRIVRMIAEAASRPVSATDHPRERAPRKQGDERE